MLPLQEKKRSRKIFRRACSKTVYIKLCSSCDFGGGAQSQRFLQHLSQQSVNPEANFNDSMFVTDVLEKKDSLQFYKDAMPKLSSKTFKIVT